MPGPKHLNARYVSKRSLMLDGQPRPFPALSQSAGGWASGSTICRYQLGGCFLSLNLLGNKSHRCVTADLLQRAHEPDDGRPSFSFCTVASPPLAGQEAKRPTEAMRTPCRGLGKGESKGASTNPPGATPSLEKPRNLSCEGRHRSRLPRNCFVYVRIVEVAMLRIQTVSVPRPPAHPRPQTQET